MSHVFRQFAYGLENQVIHLYCRFAVGASGAPTLNAVRSKGIKSIVRNATGNYTITLSKSYVDLFKLEKSTQLASGAPAGGTICVRSQDVQVAKTVTFELLDGTGTATDPAANSVLTIELKLNRSTV